MNIRLYLGICFLFVANVISAQSDVKVEPVVVLFTDVHQGLTEGNQDFGMRIRRAYLGAEIEKDSWSAKVVFDSRPWGGLETPYGALGCLKNAYVGWANDRTSVRAGIVGRNLFKYQEKFWGYRYLFKSLQDEYSYSSSADFGIAFAHTFSDKFAMDLQFTKGTGYKKAVPKLPARMTLGASYEPSGNLKFRANYDFFKKDNGVENGVHQHIASFFVGYVYQRLWIAAEYNRLWNKSFRTDRHQVDYSFYARFMTSRKCQLFARHDILTSKADWRTEDDGQMTIVGFHYQPHKFVSISPNVRVHTLKGNDTNCTLFLNFGFKL